MLQHFVAKPPFVADWVRTRTGLSFAKQALYSFKDGSRQNSRPAIGIALAEFWRIHPLLLDPTVPRSYFEVSGDSTERRTLELMTEIGSVGVNARDVKNSLGGSTDLDKQEFLAVLEKLAEHSTPPAPHRRLNVAEVRRRGQQWQRHHAVVRQV